MKNNKKHLMEKKKIIMLEGFDGSGKSSISENLAKRLGAEHYSYFRKYNIKYDIEPLSIEVDDFVKYTKTILGRALEEIVEPVIFDRGFITMVSALPKNRWEEFREYLDQITIIMCIADLDTTTERLKSRETDESGWYDSKYWIDKSLELVEYFNLPYIDTTGATVEKSVLKALDILKIPQIMYFAGSMIIDPKTNEIDLEKDYRTFMVEGEKIMTPFDPIPLGEKYSYCYPSFYYLDEENKPSLSSSLIIEKEHSIIPTIDILVVFLQSKISAGTLGELMYAAMNKKVIYVYYMPSETESEVYNTSQWYPILMSQKINPGNIKVVEVKDVYSLMNQLYGEFGIKNIKK